VIYEYQCPECKHEFVISKHHSEYRAPEFCIRCDSLANKLVSLPNINKVEQGEFNHGLGCWTKNKKHRDEIAKRKGLVEVGNETPTTIHQNAEGNKKKNTWGDI
jgi:putative FmdB family regulatory protein